MIDEAIKGWVAAMLDSRGHVTKRDNPLRAAGSYQITIYIDTSIPGISDRLCELTGTTPEEKQHKELKEEWLRRGCDQHCPEPHQHVRPVNMPFTTKWSCTGVSAAIILWNVRKYMTTEREPWDWVMAQCMSQLQLTGRGSAAILAAARRLHGLGWELPPVLAGATVPKALTAAG